MSFLETPVFPLCPRLGKVSTPQYSVTISEVASGFERRNRNWAMPRHIYSVTVGPKYNEDIDALIEFWHALGGPECGFRFKDWADYKSCRKSATITALDQGVQPIAGSPGGFQLLKTYRAGARAQTRKIVKPVQGTILIADDGGLLTEGVDYSLNYATGLADFFVAPSGLVTWGGEFDVPVRFDSEFPIESMTDTIEQVSFQLKEIRDPNEEA